MNLVNVTFLVVKPVIGETVHEIKYVIDGDIPDVVKDQKIQGALDHISKQGFIVISYKSE